MIVDLRYGNDATLQVELPSRQVLAVCDASRRPAVDPSAAIDHALDHPLGFPPLAKAAVEGDKVVLAFEPLVPQPDLVARRAIDRLVAAGVGLGDITVLRPAADAGTGQVSSQPLDIPSDVVQWTHDPSQRSKLSYLAASEDAQPIYINRLLHEADLVVAIGCAQSAAAPGFHGVGAGLYPAFSDDESAGRFRAALAGTVHEQRRLQHLTEEVRWHLGVPFAVQIVRADGDHIFSVLAGEAEAVAAAAAQDFAAAWECSVPSRAELVVCSLRGMSSEQNWRDVGRALWSAGRVMAPGGATVLCTQLRQPPGPAVRATIGLDDPEKVLRRLARAKFSDTFEAVEIVKAKERGKVYLVSQLDDEAVEELGLTPLPAESIGRLAERYPSVIVLAGAEHLVARPQDEAARDVPAHSGKQRK